MTTSLSAPPRTTGRGLNLVLAGAVLLALGWLCAIVYVLLGWAVA
ncbi:morphogenic membrane protein MmpA [Streptomyces sp. NPDC093249]